MISKAICLGLSSTNFNFLYTYIRKNGCSSWKKFFLEQSPFKDEANNYDTALKFIAKHHKVTNEKKMEGYKDKILILRNPYDRLLSGFLNRLVQHYHDDSTLKENIESISGMKLGDMTFRVFIESYLSSNPEMLDPHFQMQTLQIPKIEFNNIWDISHVYENTQRLFGNDIANRYFRRRVNSTQNVRQLFLNDAVDLKISTIYKIYQIEGCLPSKASFGNADCIGIVHELFGADYNLMRANGL